ncbi:hypothetical protein AH06_196 [Erwinia phage AH06]|nr:hypothetical protein AH06_196 [Erwinia phage AH06]
MIITDEFIHLTTLRAGLEQLETELKHITQFRDGTLNAGLESLDRPVGHLVITGLVAKYPSYIKAGSGLEGISDLIDNLKKGIVGIKELIKNKGKSKTMVSALSKKLLDEIAKNYTDSKWIEEQKFNFGKVKVPELGKLVAGSTLDDVEAAVDGVIKAVHETLTQSTKMTVDYWKPVDGKIKSLDNLKEEDARNELAKEIIAVLGSGVPDTVKFPVIATGKESDYPAINKGNVKQAGELIVKLIRASDEAFTITDPALECGVPEDSSYRGDIEKGLAVKLDKLTYTANVAKPTVELTDKARGYLISLARAVEAWIVASIK